VTCRDRRGWKSNPTLTLSLAASSLCIILISPLFPPLSMAVDKVYQYPTTPAENRLAVVYSLSTISSHSSGSSYSNYTSDPPTGPRDSCGDIPPQDVIDTLNLLEQVEQEVSQEVARIQDKIKEAREMVETYRRERRARMKENAILVAEERQTKRVDDELWLTV